MRLLVIPELVSAGSIEAERTRFDELTAAMADIALSRELDTTPELHKPLYDKALLGSYERASDYLMNNPALLAFYRTVGELAVATTEVEMKNQRSSLEKLKSLAAKGLLERTDLADIEDSLEMLEMAHTTPADEKEAFGILFGKLFEVEIMPESASISAPTMPPAEKSLAPATTTTAETAIIEVEELPMPGLIGIGSIEINRLLKDLRLSEVEAMVLQYAGNGRVFRMEELRAGVPLLKNMEHANYVSFRLRFGQLQAELASKLVWAGVRALWARAGQKRGTRYQLGTMADEPHIEKAVMPKPIPPATPRLPQPSSSTESNNVREFIRAANFTKALIADLSFLTTGGNTDIKLVTLNQRWAKALNISVEAAATLVGALVEKELAFKFPRKGSPYITPKRPPDQPRRRNPRRQREQSEGNSLAWTETNISVATQVLDQLLGLTHASQYIVTTTLETRVNAAQSEPLPGDKIRQTIRQLERLGIVELRHNVRPRKGQLSSVGSTGVKFMDQQTKMRWKNDRATVVAELNALVQTIMATND